ncbi:hypothetical protein FRACYDRAFT_227507 [Fragilariopsis cylindrus CCMP1102]|uniref:MYND-type domain-containing protein n=1 Tax=Fragilariopsis cylindrus CCMP1102 TaxID=635003 RepID=A0A1E7F444_9STRA|nr:hypothetical protein FRACYDRAFT_227507 [Fragilariopsis cylindrus CCMP1102]|eukprot:OEU12623.1 hypothetical protein FRACYDRAFT_227507 [Fragilariopsis cylindrus CCMP1102]
MGRKQKLRQEKKRNIKNKAATAEVTAAAAVAEVATTFSSKNAIVETAEEKALAARVRKEKGLALDNQLPKSDMYVQAMTDTDMNRGEQWELFKRGVTEDECVHSMYYMGVIIMSTTDEKRIHLALPWYLEGAIRGSVCSTISLCSEFYIGKADCALHSYWGEFATKNYIGVFLTDRKQFKGLKGLVGRECVICSKTDTNTFTLQQCKGCSLYCYCSEWCQTIHWKERKHRNECKQVQILNKYHKPYAKEIRDAVIRGDKEIPSLEKLRYKLGLTRSSEELTHNGKKIYPDDYLLGREDGTLWVGSFAYATSVEDK